MKDYEGDLSKFQQLLSDKGISKNQLDITNYVGCTELELNYIVDHPEEFMKKSIKEKLELLREISLTKIPKNFDKEIYIKNMDFSDITKNFVSYPADKIALYDYLHQIDLYDLVSKFRSIQKQFDDSCSFKNTGTNYNYFDKLYTDKEFRMFTYIADAVIPDEYTSDITFKQMLIDYYNEHLS